MDACPGDERDGVIRGAYSPAIDTVLAWVKTMLTSWHYVFQSGNSHVESDKEC
jgi:hypothetical protein